MYMFVYTCNVYVCLFSAYAMYACEDVSTFFSVYVFISSVCELCGMKVYAVCVCAISVFTPVSVSICFFI